MKINKVKGTQDLFGKDAYQTDYIELVFKSLASTFGFNLMRSPIIEHTELFARSSGEASDVVRKEMYTFLDKGGRSITLRPETTAGIMRAVIENKLYATNDLPLKIYYVGPNFRYERPQAGRLRQFYQMGIETIGLDNPYYDAEAIIFGYTYLSMLGLGDIKLKINSLGGTSSRANYKEALSNYFERQIDTMCDDCKERLRLNPLRILDCKVKEDQEIIKDAPILGDYLVDEDRERFEKLCAILDDHEIPYEIDYTLVRGLDYYTHVVFEYHYTAKDGTNVGAIGAGGHYDNLSEDLDGPNMAGVGLAFGQERLKSIFDVDSNDSEQDVKTDIYVMPIGDIALKTSFRMTNILRLNGYRSEVCLQGKPLKNQFKLAEHQKARLAIIIGEEELSENKYILKDLESQEQSVVDEENLLDTIDEFFALQHDDHVHED